MVEATNKLIVGNMRRNLEDKRGATTKKRATYESQFTLVYGTEAVLPTKFGLPTITTMVAEDTEEH